MKLVAAILVLSGVGYNLLAFAAAVAFRLRRTKSSAYRPPVSILKPLRGRDPMFYEALRSHLTQDYPEFEILCGVADKQTIWFGEDETLLPRQGPAGCSRRR